MTAQANTRLFDGTIIQVRNDGDTAWIQFAVLTGGDFPGNPSNIQDVSTAAGYRTRVGLSDLGTATLSVYDNPDDPFLAEMDTMYTTSAPARRFQVILPEGTLTVKEFTAWVSTEPIKGTYNTVWTQTINLEVQTEIDWAAPIT